MEIPSLSLATVERIWEWSKDNFQIWFQVLKDPRQVIQEIDLTSPAASVAALQFAFFCAVLTTVIDFPVDTVIKKLSPFDLARVMGDVVGFFVLLMIFAGAQQIASKSVFGHCPMSATFILTLYCSAFFPIITVTSYVFQLLTPSIRQCAKELDIFNPLACNKALLDKLPEIALMAAGILCFALFLMLKFIPAVQLVHRVGRIRAALICGLTMCLGLVGSAITFLAVFQAQIG